VTLMFAAGKSLEEIGDLVGHTSTYVTARYRHLLEGHERHAADALDEVPRAGRRGVRHERGSTERGTKPASDLGGRP
jgi:hypothetical protein